MYIEWKISWFILIKKNPSFNLLCVSLKTNIQLWFTNVLPDWQIPPFIMVVCIMCSVGAWGMWACSLFSSPELKAQVSFSDHLLSVVCLSVCPSVRPSVCKIFTFSSSPEPLDQFQPNYKCFSVGVFHEGKMFSIWSFQCYKCAVKGGGGRVHLWIRQSFHNQTEVIFLIGHFCSWENGRVDTCIR